MSEFSYEQRVEAGVQELCDLAHGMDQDDAEEFFQSVAHRASNGFRRIAIGFASARAIMTSDELSNHPRHTEAE